MITAHETIRQALRKAQKQVQSHAELSENPYARIADQEVDEALSLLETHAVVPREPSNEILKAATDTSGEDLERAVRKKENMADNYKAMIQQATQEANDEL